MTPSAVMAHAGTADSPATDLYALVRDLYPICRSITGDGVRATLHRLQQELPIAVHEVPSGTRVFDWTVPLEWNIRDAWIKNLNGDRLVDFQASNLHVVSYSTPVHGRMTLSELRDHLHSLGDHPEWIPYKTSYYRESWGFSVTDQQLQSLTDPEYDVCIDSTLQDGNLTYGELYFPGQSADEVIVSCHVCHPSLCNDNLSGIAVAVYLARWIAAIDNRRLSYRFLFIPGTIGSITWLARNQERLPLIRHGLVLTGLGGPGGLVYKRSRRGSADIDRAAAHVLTHSASRGEIRDFSPYGYDERQYCSPGINLPVGCLSRTPYGEYPEYHTSADNLDFVTPAQLAGSLDACRAIVSVLEGDSVYVNLQPMCEPQLGRRGLYGHAGGAGESREREMAMLWVLNLSDGTHSLLDVAERAGLPFEVVRTAAVRLREAGLLEERPQASGR